jgi:DNA-binding MarR family transcriptional regulator
MESEDIPEALKAIAGEIPDYLFYLMFHATRQREAVVDVALAETGLNMNRLRALSVIRRLEGCTMKDLARLTAIDRTTLTRAVDQLVEQGLVQRSTPAGDRRKVHLGLTADGQAFYDQAIAVINDYNRRAWAGVAQRDQIKLLGVLHQLIRNLSPDQDLAKEVITFGGADRHRAVA